LKIFQSLRMPCSQIQGPSRILEQKRHAFPKHTPVHNTAEEIRYFSRKDERLTLASMMLWLPLVRVLVPAE